MQPATEHGFWFPPPCFLQCFDPDCTLVVHPSYWHVPRAPCVTHTPRAAARVVQPFVLHTFVLPPLCLPHLPFATDWAAVVQLPNEQNPLAPCGLQSPRAIAAVPHPSVEQTFLCPACVLQSPPFAFSFLSGSNFNPCSAVKSLPTVPSISYTTSTVSGEGTLITSALNSSPFNGTSTRSPTE